MSGPPVFGPAGSCPQCGQFNCTRDHAKELVDEFERALAEEIQGVSVEARATGHCRWCGMRFAAKREFLEAEVRFANLDVVARFTEMVKGQLRQAVAEHEGECAKRPHRPARTGAGCAVNDPEEPFGCIDKNSAYYEGDRESYGSAAAVPMAGVTDSGETTAEERAAVAKIRSGEAAERAKKVEQATLEALARKRQQDENAARDTSFLNALNLEGKP